MSREKELQTAYTIAVHNHEDRLRKAPDGLDWSSVEAYMKPTRDIMEKAHREYRLVKTPEFDSEPCNENELMQITDFIQAVKQGHITDEDGCGYYARDGRESNIEIYPADVKHGKVRKDFTLMTWTI